MRYLVDGDFFLHAFYGDEFSGFDVLGFDDLGEGAFTDLRY